VLTKTTDRFYIECHSLRPGIAFALIGLLSLASCVRWIMRRKSGELVLTASLACLCCINLIGGTYRPPHYNAESKSRDYLFEIGHRSEHWYDSHGTFPASEVELRQSLRQASDENSSNPVLPNSAYSRNNQRLGYELVVVNGATGPRTDGLSERPAVIYYCVSSDRQRFWATITVLPADFARTATLLRNTFEHDNSPWVVQSLDRHGSQGTEKR
jgi:hypothetical protein